jgi:subtilisin family serine protease
MLMAAPGENVVVPRDVNGLSTEVLAAGTSWASPQVVGAAALIKQISPKFTPAQILFILQQSGTPVFDTLSNQTYRELNLDAALKLATKQARRLRLHAGVHAKH